MKTLLTSLADDWEAKFFELRGEREENESCDDEVADGMADVYAECAAEMRKVLIDAPTLHQLIVWFVEQDDDAKAWGATPEEFSEAPDCDVMSKRFAAYLKMWHREAEAVELTTSSMNDPMCGPEHWVTEVDGLWVDWTARQFHNVEGVYLAYDEIACPTIYLADNPHHPVPGIIASRKES